MVPWSRSTNPPSIFAETTEWGTIDAEQEKKESYWSHWSVPKSEPPRNEPESVARCGVIESVISRGATLDNWINYGNARLFRYFVGTLRVGSHWGADSSPHKREVAVDLVSQGSSRDTNTCWLQ
jgi:hypothetical protein